jgi:hypothetical protein
MSIDQIKNIYKDYCSCYAIDALDLIYLFWIGIYRRLLKLYLVPALLPSAPVRPDDPALPLNPDVPLAPDVLTTCTSTDPDVPLDPALPDVPLDPALP